MKKIIFLILILYCFSNVEAQLILTKSKPGSFALVSSDSKSTILYDDKDDALIRKSSALFQKDLEMIGASAAGLSTILPSGGNIILIGTIGKSKFIRQLIKEKKLNTQKIQNKWEAYQIQIVKNPFRGISQALVICGSDRRGTAFGVFELSRQMGVSPWYWWADVPVVKKKELYINPGTVLTDAPKVQYRGIFINDEAPALSGWSKEKFGGFNHLFYEKVFELMLRLKSNYLWPAMWGNAFYDDDSLNIKSADEYGIVIGTSHHEPLMRAHDEWRRYGKGKWNYDSNAMQLQQFWKTGMKRATNEKIVSIGMRGDGDEPMSRETATALLERIVKDQRKIIKEVTGKPESQTPQLWALYKEVQDYYDKGMRVPDDVTLLLCDDNWGNIRKLPKLDEKARAGGYGIYYHFDYVGGPRNYKWLNTNNIARVWEQMHLAWEYGAKKIWIVNVGDIKPMELPISFFLDYAWDPEKWDQDNLRSYYTQWAEQQFGSAFANQIGEVMQKYSQLSARRKPELLNANTYNLFNYEFERVVYEWKELEKKAEDINNTISVEYKDAFFQLALHPIKAFSNLHQMYFAVAQNKRYAERKFDRTNVYADNAKQLYQNDSLLTIQYHKIANGKWNQMMAQTHIGYTYWQQPAVNKMPDVVYIPDNQKQPTRDFGVTDILNATIPDTVKGNVFAEEEGYVSMEAEHWTKAIHLTKIKWGVIPDIGRTGSGVTSFPVTMSSKLSTLSPHLEYDVYTFNTHPVELSLYFSPTLNFHNDEEGLKYAISIDDEEPQIISINKDDNKLKIWESWVANNILIKTTKHKNLQPGKHVVKYWLISQAVILQKLVLHFDKPDPYYLGYPETIRK